MRTAVTVLVALHGAIHVLGFLKWANVVPVPQLNGRTLVPLPPASARVFALLWLAACVILLATAALRLARSDLWWMAAVAGLVLSQVLIVVAWSDAKFGSLANVVLLVSVVVAAAQLRFDRAIDAEIRAMLAKVSTEPTPPVTATDLARLPTPVRTWLERSGVVGRPRVRTVRLKQRAQIRTAPDAAWMPAEAEQYFRVDDPAFIWRVEATMFGLLPVAGRDMYADGHGHMLIKAASLLNVVDAADEKIAHGALLRLLGEMMWFPSGALGDHVAWEAIDARNARAVMHHAGLDASAVFTFDEWGRVVGMHASRYLGGGERARLSPWAVTCSAWRKLGGVLIPTEGDVRWNLPEGDFSYYRWTILELESDEPELYPEGASTLGEPAAASTRAIATQPGSGRR